jgi:hypothetical protein
MALDTDGFGTIIKSLEEGGGGGGDVDYTELPTVWLDGSTFSEGPSSNIGANRNEAVNIPLNEGVQGATVFAARGLNEASMISGSWAGALSGEGHAVATNYSVIAGGQNNLITVNPFSESSDYNSVLGGSDNIVSGTYSTIGGGSSNRVGNPDTEAAGDFCTVGGGSSNAAEGLFTAVLGGSDNAVRGGSNNSSIVGGSNNVIYASGYASFIGGGEENQISNEGLGEYAVICGGQTNNNRAQHSFIGGGKDNTINPVDEGPSIAFIGGGEQNSVTANYGVVVGGNFNRIGVGGIQSDGSAIGGGLENDIRAVSSVVIGGEQNRIDGNYGVILGGRSNRIAATAANSVTVGTQAWAQAEGQFAFACGQMSADNRGARQTSEYVLRGNTLGESVDEEVELFTSGFEADAGTSIPMHFNRTYLVDASVIARDKTSLSKAWRQIVLISRADAVTTLSAVTEVTTITSNEGAEAWTLEFYMGNGNIDLRINTHASTAKLNCVAHVRVTEVYGALEE